MTSIADWLSQQGLAEYVEVFEANEIDFDALRLLTEADLAQIGVPLPVCKQMLQSVARAKLSQAPRPDPPTVRDATAVSDAEHRQLTVMFVDLVGWTALTEQTDPYLLPSLIRRYHEVTAAAVRERGGSIVEYRGDGILIYFGYPATQEDAAENAVQAGLEVLAHMRQLTADLDVRGMPPLHVRIGIHSGLAVISEIGRAGYNKHVALGAISDIAARVQSIAQPDSLRISMSTRALIARKFRCSEPRTLEGIREPVQTFRVLGRRIWHTRFRASRHGPQTSFVGREIELEILEEHCRLSRAGTGRALCIGGEAGIGKSRLVDRLRERVRGRGVQVLVLQCEADGRSRAFHPLIAYARRTMRFDETGSVSEKLDRIERALSPLRREAVDEIKLLASLLSVPFERRYGSLRFDARGQRTRTLRMLLELTEAAARHRPLVLAIEDAHWADASTIEFLVALTRRATYVPLLLLVTHRPEFDANGLIAAGAATLALPRLTLHESRAIVSRIDAAGALDASMIEDIVDRSDGNPLYLEEITSAVLEVGRDDVDRAIPATLRDSLMARIDRVPSGQPVAQIGALIGREFSRDLLTAVAGDLHIPVGNALKDLAGVGVLIERSDGSGPVYRFRHALLREICEDSLLKSARRAVHRRIAYRLEDDYAAKGENHPETLAYHYCEAGEHQRAAQLYLNAAKQASSRLAHLEAIKDLESGEACIKQSPPGPERDRLRLELNVMLGALLVTTRGYAAAEVGRAYDEAARLCEAVDDPQLCAATLRGQAQFLLVRARYEEASARAGKMLEICEANADAPGALDARTMLGVVALFRSDLVEAHALLSIEDGCAPRHLDQLEPAR